MQPEIEVTEELANAALSAVTAFSQSIYEQAVSGRRGPTKDEVMITLQACYGPLLCAILKVDSVTVEDHVDVEIEDLNGEMTRFKMNMEPKTKAGESMIEIVNMVSAIDTSKEA